MDFIFDPSLVLYLPLYQLDGSPFMSKAAYGHLCTVTGASWRPNGRYFDGVDDIISIPDTDTLDFGTGDFSVMVWVKLGTQTDSAAVLVGKDDEGSPRRGWQLFLSPVTPPTYPRFYVVSTAGEAAIGTVAVTDGAWHFIVGVKTSDALYIYTDAADEQTAAHTLGTVSNAVPLDIGNRTGKAQRGYVGLIGEVIAYNRRLTPLEIQHNYLATKWRYR